MVKKVKSNRDKRFAVMVMGMHRSGTSALSGVLARLGCEAPKDLMPAAPQNPKGFYESLSISALNDALLASGGSKWYAWQEFNKGWFRSPKMPDFLDRAEASLNRAFDNARLIALKDPRIGLLVPFWDEVLRNSGYTPLYLHTHRHPLEVAASLETWAAAGEDRLPGYDPRYGQLLWLRYVLEAEVATRGQTRHFTSYDRLMADWRREMDSAAGALDLAWPMLSDSVAAEIDSFLEGALNREGARLLQQGGAPRMLPWVARCYEILEAWAQQGEKAADYPVLDQILAEFNAAAPMFGPLVETGRQRKAELDEVRRETDELRRQAEASGAEARALLSTLSHARSKRAEAEAALQGAKEQLHALQDQANSAHQGSVDLEHSTREATDRIAVLESELAQRRAETDDLTKELERLRAEHAALQAALEAANQRNDALQQRAQEDQQRAQEEARELERLRAEQAAMQGALDAERQRSNAIEQRAHDETRALEQARAELNELLAAAEAGRHSAQALEQERQKSALLAAENENLARTARSEKLALERQLREELSTSLQQLRDREAAARAEAVAFETGLTALRESLKDLRAERQAQQEALAAATAEARDAGSRLAATTGQLELLKSELESTRSARATLESEREQFQRELRLERSREEEARKEALLDAVRSARMRADESARASEERARETIARAEAEAAAARRDQEMAQERLRAAEHRVNELLNSTSWRITGPLRRIVTALRPRKR